MIQGFVHSEYYKRLVTANQNSVWRSQRDEYPDAWNEGLLYMNHIAFAAVYAYVHSDILRKTFVSVETGLGDGVSAMSILAVGLYVNTTCHHTSIDPYQEFYPGLL